MVILDTDLITLLSRRDNEASIRLGRRLEHLPNADIVTTIITYEEQMRGWLAFVAKARHLPDEIKAYDRLVVHVKFYRGIPTLPFNELAAIEFQRIRQHRIRIGTLDMKIAAIALSQKATLLSRNLRDFRQMPDLDVQDWSA
jgi:tRNA(fMet)-specific endonuclease VapC